jgi:hypothetical protein
VRLRIPGLENAFDGIGGTGTDLSMPSEHVAARAIADGTEACVDWLRAMAPHFGPAFRSAQKGFSVGEAIGLAKHLVVVQSCGIEVPDHVERFAAQALDVLSESPSSLSARAVQEVATYALGLGALPTVARVYGSVLARSVEPGRTHSFGIGSLLQYLASGLAARIPAIDLEPAFVETVKLFPYALRTKKLEYAGLVAIARAYYTFALGFPKEQTIDLLHHEVRVRGLGPRPSHLKPNLRLVPMPPPTRAADIPGRSIRWRRSGNAMTPYVTELDGHRLSLRLGDFPAEPLYTLYTLECDGKELLSMNSWPAAWVKPQ